jgi:hypothetical protein
MALGSRPQTPNVPFETDAHGLGGAGHRRPMCRLKPDAHGLGEQATDAQCAV